MTTPTAPRHRWARGFSLLEVVVAAGLLLFTVSSVTAAVTSISRSGRRTEATMRADGVLGSVISRLARLPFCPVTLPSSPEGDWSAAGDLVTAVFPDAGAPHDSADARYVAADGGGVHAGSFVTRLDQDGALITCVARFRHPAEGGWLQPLDLTGWDVAASGRLPASVLVVEVSVAAGGVIRTGLLVRQAGADAVPSPQLAPAVGGP